MFAALKEEKQKLFQIMYPEFIEKKKQKKDDAEPEIENKFEIHEHNSLAAVREKANNRTLFVSEYDKL